MISHKYKLIFIHIPKCAGTSIENALGHYDNHTANRRGQDHRSIRMIEQPLWTPSVFTNKENLKELVRRIRYSRETIYNENNRITVNRDEYRSYYKFTVVRNPWARAYSWYRNVLKDPVHRTRYGLNVDISLSDFLERFAGSGMLQTQTHWLKNFKGDIPMDFIGKFENLAEDFSSVVKNLGLINIALPHKVKGTAADYREHYDQASIDRIAKVYEEEISLFGYSFEQ